MTAVALVMALWVLATWVLAAGHAWLLAVAVGLGYPAVYLVSLVAPWARCRRCSGSDRRPWLAWRGAYRRGCRSRWCRGGDRVRLGVRVLQPQRARRLVTQGGN